MSQLHFSIIISIYILKSIICFIPKEEYTKQKFIKIINTTHFSCDNDKHIFPIKNFNDDYCDCDDGSDENKTNACPNGRFQCKNTLYYPKIISTQKLNDNLCDCCDGSDEINNKCPNTCLSLSEKEFEKIFNEFTTFESVIASYDEKNNKEYFNYNFNYINYIIELYHNQTKLLHQKNLIHSYIREIEINLENSTTNKIDSILNVSLIDLRNLEDILENKIKVNKEKLKEVQVTSSYMIKYGLYYDLGEECIDVRYNDYKCNLCLKDFSCSGSNSQQKEKRHFFGKFSKFDGNVAYFENGHSCNNYDVSFSARIKFECGTRDSFVFVNKDNRCLYNFIYYTKIGCNNNKLNNLINKIKLILREN